VTKSDEGELIRVAQSRAADLGGGLAVRRALPQPLVRAVGPFVFLDHFGPHRFAAGTGMDVRPHPHIGLATITWLLEGALLHRDSLGSVQRIAPGEVNWMTAGRGIVDSERTPPDLRAHGSMIHGLQFWVGLPDGQEEVEPSFEHVTGAALPAVQAGAASGTLVVGSGFGARSPVGTFSPLVLAVFELAAGNEASLPAAADERGIYVVEGAVAHSAANEPIAAGSLVLLRTGTEIRMRAVGNLRFAFIGGRPLGPRLLDWNFVSSRRERLEQAKADWAAMRFPPVPGETEFIPLPRR
jgi:hypothetical protein